MSTQTLYPNIAKSILLATFLLIPFLFRFVNSSFEMYPAILFPSGASIVNTKDTLLVFNKYELFGIDSLSNNKKQLNPKRFLDPIPMHYWTRISTYDFGLDSLRLRKVSINRLNLHFEDELYFPTPQVENTKKWLREKLKKQSCYDSLFYITTSQVFFDQFNGKIDSSIIISEKNIQLY